MIFAATALWQVTGVEIAQPVSDVLSGLISLPFLIHFLTKKHGDKDSENESKVETANEI